MKEKADMIEKIELDAMLYCNANHKGNAKTYKKCYDSYIAGRTVGIDEMKGLIEWIDDTYARVRSEELKKSAWVNCKEETVMLHGSDYHYTTLVKEKGITTEKLIEIYFQHHLKSMV